MRILMFGWEFPPHISGGLGTACYGMTQALAKLGAQVFAFEMDADNYKNCLERVGGNPNITLENLGLSDRVCEENYYSNNAGSCRYPNGDMRAQFVDLDTYVAQKNLPRVDYIKLDIEGAELDMLHGAAKTIARCKPKMAVSAYHKLDDLWTLAAYIKSLRPDYEFASAITRLTRRIIFWTTINVRF